MCEKGSTGRAGESLGPGNLLLCALHVVLDSCNSRFSQWCSVEATPTVQVSSKINSEKSDKLVPALLEL